MISLNEYARGVEQKEDFEEYLRCFTGYDVQSAKRSLEECESIYKDFQEKYKEKMTYNTFAETYFWEFVRLRQLSKITDQDCELNEKLFKNFKNKRLSYAHLKIFKVCKAFYNAEKDNCEEWEVNDSAELFEKEIWPKIVCNNDGRFSFEMTKLALATIVEIAYQRGKKSGR